MYGNDSISRMVAQAKMNDLRKSARTHRLSKMARNGKPSALQQWMRGLGRTVRSILP